MGNILLEAIRALRENKDLKEAEDLESNELIQSDSKEAFSHNLKVLLDSGKPRNQALAIAYSIQRKNKSSLSAEDIWNYLIQKYGNHDYKYKIKTWEKSPRYSNGEEEFEFTAPNDYIAALAFVLFDQPSLELLQDREHFISYLNGIKDYNFDDFLKEIVAYDLDYSPEFFKNETTNFTKEWEIDYDYDGEDSEEEW